MKYIGIDPGITGAIACITSTRTHPLITLYKTPTFGESRHTHNETGMAELLDEMIEDDPRSCMIALEAVHAFPGSSAVAMFNLGLSHGLWKMLIICKQVPYTLVTPQAWKKLLVGVGKNKDESRIRAIQLFPSIANQLKRKNDEGKAEALLMAEWLRRTQK